MKTFIEQKEELREHIAELERKNRQLYKEIDRNEDEITECSFILKRVGTLNRDED